MKTVKFFTLGCKVNQYDTQSIREHFLLKGFREARKGPAATCLINTCTVTSWADRQSRYIIRRCIKDNPGADIIVTGCLVEKDAASLAAIKGVGFIIGKKFLKQAPISDFEGHTRAFLKVQDGCNNRCSYCKVPLVRGNSKSRLLAQVVNEAQALVNSGFKEIVLCGICLGSFGKDLYPKISLVDILSRMEKIKGLLRIRLSSIEAGEVDEALIGQMARSKIVCRHLHIPMQSGADGVLRRMNRSYRRNDYLKLVEKVKRRLRGASITTDIMVGFPGESEGDLKDTLSLIEAIEPLRVHIFPYSSRQGTIAHGFDTELTPDIIKERVSLLKNEALKSSGAFRRRFLNRKTDVLIEERCKDRPGFWQGYAGNYIRVLVRSSRDLSNQLLKVELKKIDGDCMIGLIRKRKKGASGY